MPSYNSDLFNIDPYYDDFDKTKNYQKILFRPGYSIQARELTQLQTILQNQVERFGNHIFKDGSKVYGAESAIQTVDYLQITTTSELENFIGYEIYSGDNRAKVIHAETIDSVTYLFVQVVRGTLPTTGTVTSSIDAVLATATVTGNGTTKLFSVTEGIFFVDGFFVRTGQQYTANFNLAGVFGFDIERNYIGSNDDTTLLDPARGTYNFNAPGADRYQLVLNLNFHESEDRDDFVPLALINTNGQITSQVLYSDYSEIEKTLARRTFDESGSYVTDPFELDLNNASDDSMITLGIGTGKAYIFGYEFENQSTKFIDIDKARTTEERAITTVKPFELGSYIDLEFSAPLPSGLGAGILGGLGIESPLTVNILNSSNSIVGTADVISIQKAPSTNFYRFYLANIRFNIGQSFSIITSLKLALQTDPPADGIFASGNGANFVSNEYSSLLFPVDKGSTVKTINDLQVRMRKTFSFTTDASGKGEVELSSLLRENFTFIGDNGTLLPEYVDIYYHLFENDTNTIFKSAGSYQLEKLNDILRFSGLTLSAGYSLIATVQFRHNNNYRNAIRQKLLKNEVFTVDATDVFEDETGRSYIALNHSDVIRIRSVEIAGGDPRYENDDNVGLSVISDFMFDNGQRDYYYEFGRLYFLKSREEEYQDENGNFTFSLTINYDYFEHEGSYGFITVDSYPVGETYQNSNDVFGYEDIPLFTSMISGKTISLASCIDFRFVRDYARIPEVDEFGEILDDAGNGTGVFLANRIERPTSSSVPLFQITQTRENDIFRVAHEYYLPRIDKLILRRDFNDDTTKFEVISGTPSLIPESPADQENALTLYRMIIPAYTHNPNDIEVEGVSHKRYTMRDIGDVDKRLEKIEVLSSLTNIESKVDSITYLDSSGTELAKKAILVDDFKGHGIGDVSNDDYKCSIDFQKTELRPSFKSYNYDLSVENVSGSVTQHNNGVITLSYTASEGVTFANQPKASETLSVNPYQLTNWVGNIEMNKPIDLWFDQETRPVVKTNNEGENDAWLATSFDDTQVGFGSQWNDWEAIWSGIAPDKKVNDTKLKKLLSVPKTNEKLNSIRSYFERNLKIARVTKSVEQKIDDLSPNINSFPDHIVRILRDKTIDLSVVPYMRPRDVSLTVHNMKPNTEVRVYIDNTEVTDNVVGTLTTDNTGKLEGLTLSIPNATFLSGKRILKFVDDGETTIAEGILSSQGIYETRGQGVSSVRPIVRRRQTVSSSAIPTDVNTRKSSIRTGEQYQWLDPLAQTFFVDESENPRGLFVQDLRLFFAKKDSTLPVTVQIRPTRNGHPHPSAIVPFSEVVLYPDSVNVDPTAANTETLVTFESPIYLEPGEYALCLVSNSRDYEVYTATVGEVELGGSNRIQKQVYSGKLYRPQNSNIATADFTKDLKFALRRCKFGTTGTERGFDLVATNTDSNHNVNMSRLISYMLTPFGTGKQITYSLTNDGSVLENSNIQLANTETISTDEEVSFRVNFLNSADDVSPMFDSRCCSFVHIENIINDNTSTNDELKPYGSDAGSAVRYITKRVELPENNSANDFRVYLDCIKFAQNDLEVYIKPRKMGDSKDFDDINYIRLQRVGSEKFSSDPNDVVTEVFKLQQAAPVVDYSSFAIKVCLYSEDTNIVPVVKNMRIIALDG